MTDFLVNKKCILHEAKYDTLNKKIVLVKLHKDLQHIDFVNINLPK